MSTFENNLKQMYSKFTPKQRNWFRNVFPVLFIKWIDGKFDGRAASSYPHLKEKYASHSTAYTELDAFMFGLWFIRHCHGPIKAPKLYRITAFDNSTNAKNVIVSAKDQLKPLISWSDNPKVEVRGRKPTAKDHLLRVEAFPSKNILSNGDVLQKAVDIIMKDKFYFELNKKLTPDGKSGYDLWRTMMFEVTTLFEEGEYFVHMGKDETFKASAVKIIHASGDEY